MGFFKTSEFKSKYEPGEELGRGNFAVVKEATNRETKEKVAVKILTIDDPEEYGHIKKEIEILERLDDPTIIRMIEIFEKKFRGKQRVYIVMELVKGGELFDKIVEQKNFSEKQAREVMRTLLSALVYAKSVGIVHRDLKPENILVAEDGTIKIADWGLSKLYIPDGEGAVDLMTTMCGTPGYVAPEVLEQKGYGFSCDVWSAGIILYVMLCGFLPFQSTDRNRLFKKIKKGEYKMPSPYWDNVSAEAKDLVAKMLVVDVNKRMTADECLKHPWMKAAGGNNLEVGGMAAYQTFSHAKKKWVQFMHAMTALNRMKKMAV